MLRGVCRFQRLQRSMKEGKNGCLHECSVSPCVSGEHGENGEPTPTMMDFPP
jgi:hypothetical protein